MFYFIFVLFRFGWEIILQEIYLQKYLQKQLHHFLQKSDGTFSAKDIRRMKYYARFVPAVSGANYGVLLNRKLSENERISMLFLSAAAPMFDDYFDDNSLKEVDLREMISKPETFLARNSREEVLIFLLQNTKKRIKEIAVFMEICYKVFDAQTEAKKQEIGGLSKEEVKKITYDKGGYSTLLFLAVMDDFQAGKSAEEQAIYHFGGLVQMIDDVFDIYEDAQMGLQTLATMERDMADLRQDFELDLLKMGELFYALPLPKENIRRFLDLQLFFFTRGCVCMEQLVELQYSAKTFFFAKNYSRKELICDMEKGKNILKWMRYFAFWRKQFTQIYHSISPK